MTAPLLKVSGLVKKFPIKAGVFSSVVGNVHAVNDVSFSLPMGQTFGLVGESGCGKTTTGRLVLRLLDPTAGQVVFDGADIFSLPPKEMRELRRKIQIVFQDPYSSLNPRMTIGAIVSEPFHIFDVGAKSDRMEMAAQLLDKVGMGRDALGRYPHEFSGGQRQRVGIARAVALNPKMVVCDEPVSALDVSIQAQVVNLLLDLQEERNMAYLFISHDLALIERVCDHVGVMYLGSMMETGPAAAIYSNPIHPYTEALLSATPEPNPESRGNRITLTGETPSPINLPSGCFFHTRCPIMKKECQSTVPPLTERSPGHFAACIVR
ncbi:MAG: ATP-binding cassette domain-containing protein [Nitrospinota bacterium]|nr:ATP-binding cassette domain-containing protein [Nitrospinota bacterium]